jgi:hypothetical protein
MELAMKLGPLAIDRVWYQCWPTSAYPTYSEDNIHYKSKQNLKWKWYSQMSVLTINWFFNCHWRVAKTHQKYSKPCQTFEPGTFLINNKCETMDSCVLTKLLQSFSDNHGFWKQKITGCYVILLWQGFFRFRFLLRFFVLHKSSWATLYFA